jgi:hypothetical protein
MTATFHLGGSSLTPPIVIEVQLPLQESKLSCICHCLCVRSVNVCVLGVSLFVC